MKCPSCNVNLMMTERSGVEIDYCPDCRGIWLDRGELDKLIERSGQFGQSSGPKEQYRPSDAQYEQKHYDSSHYEYKKKKKDSFLGDLFDF
ncbi:MAG: zf-TFIIB domain-containing protein [Saprospiraceae bacterium]|nr:zf-TFIIB domain-containing protein [Saprospiraceae bacterium]